jgi:hypothetical protein
MQHILTVIWAYLVNHHDGILALVGGAGGISVAIQWFLHKYKITGPIVSFVISHVFTVATAASAYILDSVHPNAGVTWGWLWLAAQFWHRIVVNPLYNKYVIRLEQLVEAEAGIPTPIPAVVAPTLPAASQSGSELE